MSKHTPGPWVIRKRGPLTRIGPADNEFFDAAGVYGFDAHEEGANARLIAAAPDLLAACQRMVEMYVNLGMDTPSMPGFEKTTVEVARAAIARAEGR